MESPWGVPYPGGNRREVYKVESYEIATGNLHRKSSHGSAWHTTQIRCHAKLFIYTSSWILKITFRHKYYHYPHNEEVEAPRGKVTCPQPHTWCMTGGIWAQVSLSYRASALKPYNVSSSRGTNKDIYLIYAHWEFLNFYFTNTT